MHVFVFCFSEVVTLDCTRKGIWQKSWPDWGMNRFSPKTSQQDGKRKCFCTVTHWLRFRQRLLLIEIDCAADWTVPPVSDDPIQKRADQSGIAFKWLCRICVLDTLWELESQQLHLHQTINSTYRCVQVANSWDWVMVDRFPPGKPSLE